eukprot:gnl/MRDRNA2_/MRDRNA2_133017_c0_seq1.p1 gnl/MRDRNA2_/MRDRNA2_133017_c0~~gnl/MRDRNA2_/MRDRNA2_133017_c0_seq1.p1  ORF type:complete len:583 (-),score=112.02 gnl/MRDRNA2_/MRDRNA2_133017_c0_seq1:396-2144(-)
MGTSVSKKTKAKVTTLAGGIPCELAEQKKEKPEQETEQVHQQEQNKSGQQAWAPSIPHQSYQPTTYASQVLQESAAPAPDKPHEDAARYQVLDTSGPDGLQYQNSVFNVNPSGITSSQLDSCEQYEPASEPNSGKENIKPSSEKSIPDLSQGVAVAVAPDSWTKGSSASSAPAPSPTELSPHLTMVLNAAGGQTRPTRTFEANESKVDLRAEQAPNAPSSPISLSKASSNSRGRAWNGIWKIGGTSSADEYDDEYEQVTYIFFTQSVDTYQKMEDPAARPTRSSRGSLNLDLDAVEKLKGTERSQPASGSFDPKRIMQRGDPRRSPGPMRDSRTPQQNASTVHWGELGVWSPKRPTQAMSGSDSQNLDHKGPASRHSSDLLIEGPGTVFSTVESTVWTTDQKDSSQRDAVGPALISHLEEKHSHLPQFGSPTLQWGDPVRVMESKNWPAGQEDSIQKDAAPAQQWPGPARIMKSTYWTASRDSGSPAIVPSSVDSFNNKQLVERDLEHWESDPKFWNHLDQKGTAPPARLPRESLNNSDIMDLEAVEQKGTKGSQPVSRSASPQFIILDLTKQGRSQPPQAP